MAMDVYTLYAVNVNGTLIDGITNQSVGLGVQLAVNRNDGSPHPRFAGVMSQKPMISFTTRAIAKALAAVADLGASISSGVTFFFQKTQEGGIRASGSAHLKIVVGSGLIVPKTLRASQDQEAEISYEVWPVSSDGSTSPLTVTASQALAGTPNSAEKFTLGPAKFNGTNIQPQSLEIDFGLNVEVKSHSGYTFPIRAHIATTAPKVRVTTLDAGALATYTVSGTAQSGTQSDFYFRKMLEGGARVADGTAQHVKLSVWEGIINVMDENAGDDGDATVTIEETITYDGTHNPFVVSTASAIT